MFGHVFKRLVLAPHGDLVSWIATVGLWAGETALIPPVVYGLRRLLVEVVPGAYLRGVVVGLVDGWGRGVFLHFNPGPSRRILISRLKQSTTLYTPPQTASPPLKSTTTRLLSFM